MLILPVSEFSTPFPKGKNPAMYTSCLLLSIPIFCNLQHLKGIDNKNIKSTIENLIFDVKP